MELMEGTNCSVKTCSCKYDFLPFLCSHCGNKFCSDHRLRSNHDCIIASNFNSSYDSDSKSNSNEYTDRINKVTNRFANDPDNAGDIKTHFQVQTVVGNNDNNLSATRISSKVEKLKDLEGDLKNNDKTKSVARKTKELLIAKSAVGNSSIDPTVRFYVVIHFENNQIISSSGESKKKMDSLNLFFANTTTIGEMLESITKQYKINIFGSSEKPSNKSLALYTEALKNWKDFNLNLQLKDALSPYDDIFILIVDLNELIQNQSKFHQIETNKSTTSINTTDISTITNTSTEPTKEFKVGEEAVYKLSTGEEEIVKIVSIHRDDYPNVYYTILLHKSTKQERQTTSNRLKPVLKLPSLNSLPSQIHDNNENFVIPPNETTFTIIISYNGKSTQIDGIFKSMTIFQLKTHILKKWSLQKSPLNVKLISRGKILKDNETAGQNFTAGAKLTLMG